MDEVRRLETKKQGVLHYIEVEYNYSWDRGRIIHRPSGDFITFNSKDISELIKGA